MQWLLILLIIIFLILLSMITDLIKLAFARQISNALTMISKEENKNLGQPRAVMDRLENPLEEQFAQSLEKYLKIYPS